MGSSVGGCRYGVAMATPDFTVLDQAGRPWTLSTQRGAGMLLVFLRGDW